MNTESETTTKSGDALIDQQRHVLPFDRDSRDDEAPQGHVAINADGTEPRIDGDTIWIKEDSCSCTNPCGGCGSRWTEYPIDGNRFHW